MRIRTWSAVSATALCLVVAIAVPASAVQKNQYLGDSETSQTWYVAPATGNAWVSQALGGPECIESAFDWQVPSGHYDARITRRCNSSAAGILANSVWTNGWVNGPPIAMQKWGGCKVTNTTAQGLYGSRGFYDGDDTDVESVAACGSGSAACYVLKGGVIRKKCFSNPASGQC